MNYIFQITFFLLSIKLQKLKIKFILFIIVEIVEYFEYFSVSVVDEIFF